MSNYFPTHDSDIKPAEEFANGPAQAKVTAKDGDVKSRRATVTTFNQQQSVTQQTKSVLLGRELLL